MIVRVSCPLPEEKKPRRNSGQHSSRKQPVKATQRGSKTQVRDKTWHARSSAHQAERSGMKAISDGSGLRIQAHDKENRIEALSRRTQRRRGEVRESSATRSSRGAGRRALSVRAAPWVRRKRMQFGRWEEVVVDCHWRQVRCGAGCWLSCAMAETATAYTPAAREGWTWVETDQRKWAAGCVVASHRAVHATGVPVKPSLGERKRENGTKEQASTWCRIKKCVASAASTSGALRSATSCARILHSKRRDE